MIFKISIYGNEDLKGGHVWDSGFENLNPPFLIPCLGGRM